MTIFAIKSMNYRYKFLTMAAAVLLLFSACGKDRSPASNEVGVRLLIPEGENPELFWYGVQNKILRVEKEGEEPLEISWQENTRIPLDLNDGDLLVFRAFDRNARIVVEGEAKVTQEKNITIAVHRVL